MSQARWSAPAQSDLAELDDYFRQFGDDHALRVGRLLLAAGRFLAEYPQAGPQLDVDLRKWRVAQTDYVIVYRVVMGSIDVMRVHHVRRDWRQAPA